ncbi:sialin [Drosophila willistoni]|uniref:sialin n=1 Tax=Drosophila willistoni TaxID=7260 RepID=UPI00017D889A|nr:sialin [Drosophila willistoni]
MVHKSWNLPNLVTPSSSSSPSHSSLWGSVRLTYTVCAFLAMILHTAIRSMLGLVILSMVKQREDDTSQSTLNGTAMQQMQCGPRWLEDAEIESLQITGGDLPWTRNQELAFPGIFYYGYVITLPLAGHLSDRFGSKLLFIISLILQGITYLLLPVMAHHSFAAAATNLIITGMFAGCGNPSIYQLFVIWAHPSERTALLSFAYSGIVMGTIIIYPVASYLSQFGWEMPFYMLGCVVLLYGTACYWLIYDDLNKHPRLTIKEKAYLQPDSQITPQMSLQHLAIPWRSLLTSVPVYAFILTHIFHNYGYLLLSLVMPRFMREAMQFSLAEVGLLSSAPYVGSLFSKLICILSCSYIERRVDRHLGCMRRLLYATCMVLSIIFVGGIIMADCGQKIVVIMMYVLLGIVCDMGFSGGYWPTLLYFAPSFAGLLSGVANCLGHLSGFLAPYIVAALVSSGLKTEWNTVLITLALFNGLAMIMFSFLSSTKLQDWDPRSISNNIKFQTATASDLDSNQIKIKIIFKERA